MKGKGIGKTIYKDMELVSVVNFDVEDIELSVTYGFTLNNDVICGKGILVCYSGDLNDILEMYNEEPLKVTIKDGVIYKFVLSNGIAALKTTNIIRYEDIVNSNYVNAFNNGLDLIHIRKEFDKFAEDDLFKNTVLPSEAYYSLKSLFHGGVMNAHPGVYYNVKSADLVSAHASNIVNEDYPIGQFEKAYMSLDTLKEARKNKGIFYMGNVTFKNLRLKPGYIGIIYIKHDAASYGNNIDVTSNGYVVNAEILRISITELYMECIDMCYEYDEVVDQNLYMCMEHGKLPLNVRNYVFNKFKDKQTKPKNTKEYDEAKLLVNLCYGFLCRGTEDYNHYAYGHKLVWPFQYGVYTCLYTTYKIVKAMHEVIQKGGQVIAIATDSIKYIGDFDLEWGTNLGDLKYEGLYDEAYVDSVYRAVFKMGTKTEVKLAGCLKEKAEEYFSTHPAWNIFFDYEEIPQGKVCYNYNTETSRIEPMFFNYTLRPSISYL